MQVISSSFLDSRRGGKDGQIGGFVLCLKTARETDRQTQSRYTVALVGVYANKQQPVRPLFIELLNLWEVITIQMFTSPQCDKSPQTQ